MSDITVKPINSHFSKVSFELTREQAAELLDNLRVSTNAMYGVADNPNNLGACIRRKHVLLAAVSKDRRFHENYFKTRLQAGELEGLA